MSRIVTGTFGDKGPREIYEDSYAVENLTTPGGLNLVIAAVADGVGGENKGERASYLAIESVLETFRASPETDIVSLIRQAVDAANEAVFGIQKETDGASTTLALAIVLNGETLYIANVGDSRIYLFRGGKLSQLTIDHTFATVMVWRGKLSSEAAQDHPRAEVLMYALGPRQKATIDQGFYVGTKDHKKAGERGKKGLPLQQGDAILVCSDGLIKLAPDTNLPFVRDEEIVKILKTKEGEKAAAHLGSLALKRNADDNVTAVVIQLADPWLVWRARRPLLFSSAAVLVILMLLFIWIGNLTRERSELEVSLGQTATAAAEIAFHQTATQAAILAFTPTPSPTATPTPTLRPSLIPGEIGKLEVPNMPLMPFTAGAEIPIDTEYSQIKINHDADINSPDFDPADGLIFPFVGSVFVFEDVTDNQMSFFVRPGSRFFLETGKYPAGAKMGLLETTLDFTATGCFALDYPAEAGGVTASCYRGDCGYLLNRIDTIAIPEGFQIVLDASAQISSESEPVPIPIEEAELFADLLPDGSFAAACLEPYLPTPTPAPEQDGSGAGSSSTPEVGPTATPTATATRTATPSRTPTLSQTFTPTKTGTVTLTPTETLTKTPLPSATNRPSPTNTPLTPTSTNTPPPPTNTPPPTPTDTEAPPPTDTEVPPPTDTEVPPPTDTEVPPPTDTEVPPPTDTEVPLLKGFNYFSERHRYSQGCFVY